MFKNLKIKLSHCWPKKCIVSAKKRRGFALLLTLAGLVLLSILMLVFLASAKNERISSSLYTRGEGGRLLREAVVNLVIAQIREGTTGKASTGDDRNWISQPGAIRTYKGSQAPDLVYKLYSARDLIVPGTSFDPSSLSDIPTSGGVLNEKVFTDLNTPVQRNGKWNYPILDPKALNVVEGFTETSGASNVSKKTIPSAPAQIPMPVRWLYLLESGAIAPVDDSGVVQDDFLKNDGTPDKITARIAFWTDDESAKLNINTASSGMYWDTPIGRGNDFERGGFNAGPPSSKPVVNLTGLAASPPASKEFQRYPGHPAMTSLDVVFNNTTFFSGTPPPTAAQKVQKILELAPRSAWGGSELGTQFPVATETNGKVILDNDRLYATVDELFYKQPAAADTTRPGSSLSGTGSPAAPAMNMTADNLSLARFFLTANSRAPEVTSFNTPRVTIWPMDKVTAKRTLFDKVIAFCSTVKKSAGDPTEFLFRRSAFNPISVSPVSGASFTGASANGSQNATKDYITDSNNVLVYDYLKDLMGRPFPGFGSSLASKFGNDSDQILTEIFDYTRSTNLFDCSDPTFKGQYTGRPFYLYEGNTLGSGGADGIFKDLPLPRDPAALNLNVEYYVPSAYAGQVVPIEIGSTRGLGRFPTVVGATLIFFATDSNPAADRTSTDTLEKTLTGTDVGEPAKYKGQNPPYPFSVFGNSLDSYRSNASTLPPSLPAGKIRCMLVLSMANPGPGPMLYTNTYDVRVTGMDTFAVNGANAQMQADAINRVLSVYPRIDSSGAPQWEPQFYNPILTSANVSAKSYSANERPDKISPVNGTVPQVYPFFSQSDVAVPLAPLSFTGGEITIELLVDNQAVQTTKINFAKFDAPMPRWSPVLDPGNPNTNPLRLIDCKIMGAKAQQNSWASRIGIPMSNNDFSYKLEDANTPVYKTQAIRPVLMPCNLDTARGVELAVNTVPFGDMRLVAGLRNVPSSYFQKCRGNDYDSPTISQVHSLRNQPLAVNGNLVSGVSSASQKAGQIIFGMPSTFSGARRSDGAAGDWDMGTPTFDRDGNGYSEAGAFINRPGDGAATYRDNEKRPKLPFFNADITNVSTDNAFSPNRLLPSAGMFGSLPVGVKRGLPWQTLLFRPNIPSHPGAANPPDHLILDLFQMPVVEPYAISDPFSTAGKVNLNYQIAPFSYIKRSTALRGVLYAEKIIAVPTTNAYMMSLNPDGILAKPYNFATPSDKAYNYRYNVDRDATMTLFDERFANNQPFLTASQICEMPLVPKPENKPSPGGLEPPSVNPFQTALAANANASAVTSYVTSFWNNTTLGGGGTADNLRERPYTTIYPRVTTKSNAFQIHMKVQGIQKARSTKKDRMEAGDSIVSEYQGAAIIERFLDPTQATFDPDDANAQLGPYKFRVVTTKQFTP